MGIARTTFRFCVILAVAVIAALGPEAPSAHAQGQGQTVKAKDLIGYAVEQVGPKHEDVDLAIQKFLAGDVPGCLELLQQATRKDPNLPAAELTLAKLYLLANQGPAARSTLEKYADQNPNDPEPILIFGEQAVSDGQVTDAKLLFGHAAKLTGAYKDNPLRAKNYVIRSHAGEATVAEMREDWPTAIKELQAWLEADPKNVVALQRLGRAKFQKAEEMEAYKTFLDAYKIDDKMIHPDMMIAGLYDQKGDRDNAEKFVQRALRNTSANLPTKLAAIRWLVETDQLNRAKPELDQVVAKNTEEVQAQLFAGIVSRMMGDDTAAQSHLEKAYLLDPTNFDAQNQLALFLIAQPEEEKRDRAVKLAENNVRIHQNNSEAAVALGWIYYQMGRTREAEQLLNQALRVGRLSADSSYFVAKIFWDRGKNDTAAKLLQQALGSKRVFVHRTEARALLQKINPQAGKKSEEKPAEKAAEKE